MGETLLIPLALPDFLASTALFALFAVALSKFSGTNKSFVFVLLGTGLVLYGFGVLRLLPGTPIFDLGDGNGYLRWGYQITEVFYGRLEPSDVREIWPGKGVWPLIIGLTGLLVPKPILFPLMVNIVLMLVTVLVSQKTFSHVTASKSKSYVLPLMLLNPGFIMWGTTLMRENLAWLGLALVGLSIARRGHKSFQTQLFTAGGGFALVMATRDDLGAAMTVIVAGTVLLMPFMTKSLAEKSLRAILSGRFAFTLGFVMLLAAAAWWYLSSFATRADLDLSSEVAKRVSSKSQADAQTAVSKTSPIAVRAIGGLFGPFPHEYGASAVLLLVSLGTLYFGVLLMLVAARIRAGRVQETNEAATLLIIATVVAGIVGILVGNYGAITRLTVGLTILVTPHAAATLEDLHRRRRRKSPLR